MAGELARRLDATCVTFASQTAIVGATGSLTYAELSAQADGVARALRARHAEPDEPVIVTVGNRPADFAALLGTWRADCVAVPVHCGVPPVVADDLVTRTGARFVIDTGGPIATPLRVLASSAPEPRAMLRGAALVVFTSGSTGQPKGVVLSHRAFDAKLIANDSFLNVEPGTGTLLLLQITFSYGLWVSLLTLVKGAAVFVHERFDPGAALDAMVAHRIARVAFVPTMLRGIVALAEQDDARLKAVEKTATLTQVMTGGEPLGAVLGTRVRTLFPGARIVDIFGLTETSTSDFVLQGDDLDAYPGCIGRPAPGIAFRIAPAAGIVPAAGGELQLRTPMIMNGYLDAPELTAAAFDDGWFRTGDLARQRAPGVVELVGRAKEIISRGGSKVAPLEVEQVLLQHPAVSQALVTGVPDARLGETIHALVVLRSGVQASADSLRTWAAARLERYKLPDVFHFATELPLGRTGKADRGRLREIIVGAG